MDQPNSDHGSRGWRRTFNVLGVIVLLVGISGAAWVYRSGDRDEVLENSKKYDRSLEMMNGPVGILIARWQDPGPMAVTILLGTVTVASGCFFLGRRL